MSGDVRPPSIPAMQIGKPQRVYVIEPIENPVPAAPAQKPAERPETQPVAPKTR